MPTVTRRCLNDGKPLNVRLFPRDLAAYDEAEDEAAAKNQHGRIVQLRASLVEKALTQGNPGANLTLDLDTNEVQAIFFDVYRAALERSPDPLGQPTS